MTDPNFQSAIPTTPIPPAAPGVFRCAGLDVGTNSVKLLLADLTADTAERVFDTSLNTRLGEGMHAYGGRLREAPMRRTLDALDDLVAFARNNGATEIAAVGTAALRDAENREEFLQRADERFGVEIEVIPGEEEARLSYLAVRRDPHWRHLPRLIVIDVGGGSTEVIQGEPHSDQIVARLSVNLGAVRLTETYLKSDPPTIAQLAEANRVAAEGFARVSFRGGDPGEESFHIVGVGGTLTNLGAMHLNGVRDLERLHGLTLRADDLESQIERLASRSVEQRKTLPGLDPRRADIILGGAILLSHALARIHSASVDVSTRGLRWGVLYDRFLR